MTEPRPLPVPDDLAELVKAAIRAEQRAPGFLGEDPDDELPEVEEEEDALFADHDAVRGHGRGAYVFDHAEARSRRVDAMELADPDRGPIPLPPGGADADAIALELGKNAED